VTDQRHHTPNVACDELGCANQAVVVIGIGPRRFGRQRLDQVRLLCEAHARQVGRRRLFELQLQQWLKADLTPFHRRWHRTADLDEYIRAKL
jgi:hypothetical protein